MKLYLVVFCVLCAFIACLGGNNVFGVSGGQNLETEIRAAICEIENGNFKSAQAALETVLKKDPKNLYALKLLPGVAARQIKENNKSPENLSAIRKAIAAYESAAANLLLKNERDDINDFIITLYGMIGGEEKTTALLKKAENESETPKQRARYYTALAADNYVCANDISDVAPVKSTVRRNGEEVYVFRKPRNAADFEKLKNCAAKGSELISKAIALDPESDSAWSYQADLFVQNARIAEMEGKTTEKARFLKKYDAAREKFLELSEKRSDEQKRLADDNLSKSSDEGQNLSFTSVSESELKEFTQDLKTYRYEIPLAETIDHVYIPFELVYPVSKENEIPPDDTTTKNPRSDEGKHKRDWKIFSPEGGFSALLPSNAAFSSMDDSRIYTADGDGLSFFILETSRTIELSESEQDLALNISAWIITKYFGRSYVGDGKWNDRFESELTRKDKFNDRSARFYSYRIINCREKKEGTMIFVIGKKKNYSININGAAESDERVQKFLKSLKMD
jgi:tetratricopeptide (TPR) repeat protein